MITVYSDDHRLQDGKSELKDGQLLPCFEMPRRADIILSRVRETGLGEVIGPKVYGEEPLRRVHAPEYIDFLRTAWEEWLKSQGPWDALPLNWLAPGMRRMLPSTIEGRLGYYSFDAGTPITAGTWRAATAAANVALTGAALLTEESGVFALCRPPGHHAGRDFYGGYCFFNNAAVAAQSLRDSGIARVVVLDVDFHHGNGTQEIFYERDDVLTVSLHGHPSENYPFFLGFEDETGRGAGEGFNANYALANGTAWNEYERALADALTKISEFGAGALVVSLGVDTFEGDPISNFRLRDSDFAKIGKAIAQIKIPTLFVMEGGYAVDALGINVVNVLQGYETYRK